MEFITSVEKLKKALSVSETLSRKGVLLSILEKVYISTSGNSVLFYTTNLRSSILFTIPARVKTNGEVLCDGSRILHVLQYVKDEQCTCSLEGGVLKIATTQVTVEIPTYPKDDFPVPGEVAAKKGISLTSRECIEVLDLVSFAAASGEVHPELGSIFFKTFNGSVITAATDSFRLSEARLPGSYNGFEDGILIPGASAQMLVKILQAFDIEAVCNLSVVDSTFQCSADGLMVRMQLTGGAFPDYEKIIPSNKQTECTLATSELMSAFKLCGAFSDSFQKVRLTCDPKAGTFIIASEGKGNGSATVTGRAELTGEPMSCIVNAGYIIPFLQHAHTDAITLISDGEQKPLLFIPHGSTAYRYVVMPMVG